jgi:two-component system OmpR family response regulator
VIREPHILVVDDDREIRTLLEKYFARNGLRVSLASDTKTADQLLAAGRFDLIVLDIMLPGEDGLAYCRRLRRDADVPIVMLTAMTGDADRIIGLELGADDYVVKPFNPRELVARIRAVLRRTHEAPEATPQRVLAYHFAGWTLDTSRRVLIAKDGTVLHLSSGEFDLLSAFACYPQRVLTRDQLSDIAHGRQANVLDRSIDVQVSRLRRKIEVDVADPQLIKTVRGGGYLFTPTVTSDTTSGGAS